MRSTPKPEVVPGCSEVVPSEVVRVVLPLKGERTENNRTPQGENDLQERPHGNDLDRKKRTAAKQAKSRRTPSGTITGNVRGNSRDPRRGAACTPLWLARAVGPWDLDPFSNPRSHVESRWRCMLERGDDGLLEKLGPGFFRSSDVGENPARANEDTRLWGQPDYRFTLRAFNHYRHTRWCFLLRFDPRPEWFEEIYERAELVAIPRGTFNNDATELLSTTFNFELAPGLCASGNTFPHALYFRDARDATAAVLRTCICWKKRRRE